MPNRNSRGADSSGYNPKHLKNTDNESTQYISPNADNYDTAGFSTAMNRTGTISSLRADSSITEIISRAVSTTDSRDIIQMADSITVSQEIILTADNIMVSQEVIPTADSITVSQEVILTADNITDK